MVRIPRVPAKHITGLIEANGRLVLNFKEIGDILSENRLAWRLPDSLSVKKFIAYLEGNGGLRPITLVSAHYSDLTRYAVGDPSPYQVALSVKAGTFLSHGTAAFLHELTDQIAHTIYVNAEQSAKPRSSLALGQEAIHRAFRAPQRVSKLTYKYGEWRIIVTSGKNTGRMEVAPVRGPGRESLEATKLERTLIDLAVRPAYAGGPHAVLEAFRRAKGRCSTNVLVATLKSYDYVYPYHQVVGFYLERADYPDEAISRFAKMPMEFDFYLTHGVKDPEHVKQWRLYIPRKF